MSVLLDGRLDQLLARQGVTALVIHIEGLLLPGRLLLFLLLLGGFFFEFGLVDDRSIFQKLRHYNFLHRRLIRILGAEPPPAWQINRCSSQRTRAGVTKPPISAD